MAVVKFTEIEKRYTQVVAQYMAKGLTVDTVAMRGSQGELCNIALTDGKVVYLLYLDTTHSFMGSDTVVLKVKMQEKQRSATSLYWFGDGTVVYEEVWYKLGGYAQDRDGYPICATTEQEALDARDKQVERYRNRPSSRMAVKYDPAKVVEIVKAITGRKRVHPENITSVDKVVSKDEIRYRITTTFANCTIVNIRQKRAV